MFHSCFKKTDSADNSIFLPVKDKWHHHGSTDYYIATSFFGLLGNDSFHIEVSLKECCIFKCISKTLNVILQQYLGSRPPSLGLMLHQIVKYLLRSVLSTESF